MTHYDFITLGGGNAGIAASKRIAAAGKRVALIDPTPIGGLCSLRGCNPKKVLVRATEALEEIREAGEHGIRTREVQIDWSAVIDRKHRFTDSVTEQTEASLGKAGVEHIKAPARFVAPDRLEVHGREISFDAALVATGSSPRRLAFPGADHTVTSDDILEMRRVPERLVIIGAGVVAFELGHVFARLGSAVHVLMRGREALAGFDRDIVAKLVEHSGSLGITFHEAVEVERIDGADSALSVVLDSGVTLPADVVLNAAGRPPNLSELGLEAAGVEYSDKGVVVDEYLRSPGNRRVLAAGDAHGRRQLSPVASYEGKIVARNVLGGDIERVDVSAVPSAVFTVPPLATVGLTEAKAREQGLAVDVALEDMSEWTVSSINAAKTVHAKLVTEQETGRILGAHMLGAKADEMIHVFAMAMRFAITTRQLSEMIYVYPTFSSNLAYLTPEAAGME